MTRTLNEGLAAAPTFTPHRVNVVDVDDASLFRSRAFLDLGTLAGGNLDTIVEAILDGVDGNDITVSATGDRTDGTVTLVEGATSVAIHYDDDVSTVEDVEDALAASTLIRVKTAGTPATVLDAATDDFTATNLAGGDNGVKKLWGLNAHGWDDIIAHARIDGSSATIEVLFWNDDLNDYMEASPAVKWTGLSGNKQLRFQAGGQRFFLHCSGTFTRIDIDVAGAQPSPG